MRVRHARVDVIDKMMVNGCHYEEHSNQLWRGGW